MRLVLAAHRLAAIGADTLAQLPALARIAAYADAPAQDARGLGPFLFAAAGRAPDTPAAPIAARGAGLALATGDVQFADPVTLIAGRDDALLAGRVDDLTPGDAGALVALLNAHFADDALTVHAPRPDTWFLVSRGVPLPETTPLAAVSGAIAPQLPRGGHAKRWRRWISEMQMLLHEHPVNVRREAEGRAPVTGLWLWGGGEVAAHAAPAAAAIFAPDGGDGDLARGLAGGRALPTPARWADVPAARDALVVLPAVTDVAALARDWLDPAVTALERGTLAALTLLADDGHAAFAWHARTPSWWRRTRAMIAPPVFSLPVGEASP